MEIGIYYDEEDSKMSFENGYNMFNYCGKLFTKYKEDKLVFYKALQLFSSFGKRNDYPYCTDELSAVCERILGYDLSWVSDYLWRYTLSEQIEWDATNAWVSEEDVEKNLIEEFIEEDGNKIVSSFKNDMEAFFITLTPLFEDLFNGETSISRIDRIAQKQAYGEDKTIRFIRKDGETFDFTVTKNDIDKIVDAFSHMK